jgi:hypothetical protein
LKIVELLIDNRLIPFPEAYPKHAQRVNPIKAEDAQNE